MESRRKDEDDSSTTLADLNDHFRQSKAEQILKFLRDQEELNERLKNNSISDPGDCETQEKDLLREAAATTKRGYSSDAVRPKTAVSVENRQVQRGSTAPTTYSGRPSRPKTSYGRKRVMTTPAPGNRSKTSERQSETLVTKPELPRPKTAGGYYVLSEPALAASSGDTDSISSIRESNGFSSSDETDTDEVAVHQTRRTAADRSSSSQGTYVKRGISWQMDRQTNKSAMGGDPAATARNNTTKTLISIDALPSSTSANFATKIKCDASLYRKLRYKSAPSFRPLPIPGVTNKKKISVYHLPPLNRGASKEDGGGNTKNSSTTLVLQPQV